MHQAVTPKLCDSETLQVPARIAAVRILSGGCVQTSASRM